MHKLKKTLMILLAIITLTGCGGGGGSDPSNPGDNKNQLSQNFNTSRIQLEINKILSDDEESLTEIKFKSGEFEIFTWYADIDISKSDESSNTVYRFIAEDPSGNSDEFFQTVYTSDPDSFRIIDLPSPMRLRAFRRNVDEELKTGVKTNFSEDQSQIVLTKKYTLPTDELNHEEKITATKDENGKIVEMKSQFFIDDTMTNDELTKINYNNQGKITSLVNQERVEGSTTATIFNQQGLPTKISEANGIVELNSNQSLPNEEIQNEYTYYSSESIKTEKSIEYLPGIFFCSEEDEKKDECHWRVFYETKNFDEQGALQPELKLLDKDQNLLGQGTISLSLQGNEVVRTRDLNLKNNDSQLFKRLVTESFLSLETSLRLKRHSGYDENNRLRTIVIDDVDSEQLIEENYNSSGDILTKKILDYIGDGPELTEISYGHIIVKTEWESRHKSKPSKAKVTLTLPENIAITDLAKIQRSCPDDLAKFPLNEYKETCKEVVTQINNSYSSVHIPENSASEFSFKLSEEDELLVAIDGDGTTLTILQESMSRVLSEKSTYTLLGTQFLPVLTDDSQITFTNSIDSQQPEFDILYITIDISESWFEFNAWHMLQKGYIPNQYTIEVNYGLGTDVKTSNSDFNDQTGKVTQIEYVEVRTNINPETSEEETHQFSSGSADFEYDSQNQLKSVLFKETYTEIGPQSLNHETECSAKEISGLGASDCPYLLHRFLFGK